MVKIINTYHEQMPALRLIGRRYTFADLDEDGKLGSKWNEWFHNGWFGVLSAQGGLPGHENTVIFGMHQGSEMAYWIGMFFPQGTPVPEGFASIDIPAGDVGVCWVQGERDSGEMFSQGAHAMGLAKMKGKGYTERGEFDGTPCKWSFERYDNMRFTTPDDEGKVIVDYCAYINSDGLDHPGQAEPLASGLPPESSEGAQGQGNETLTRLDGVAPYSVGAQGNMFLCALATLFLKLGNYDDNKPFFCARQGRGCDSCGACGEMSQKPNLAKHHLHMYRFLQTVTGVGFMWADPNEGGDYDLKYIEGVIPPLLEDRLDFAMKAEGFAYHVMDKNRGEQEISRQIMESVREGRPVLMKQGDSPEWYVVTGFDEGTGAIYGLDAKGHCRRPLPTVKRDYDENGFVIIPGWFKYMRKVVIVTGKASSAIEGKEMLMRITGRLLLPERDVLASMVPRMIDGVTLDNARGVAGYLNAIVGYAVESRWHAGECFGSSLSGRVGDETVQAALQACAEACFDTHDTCLEIWALLGVGAHTGYRLPNLISKMMLDMGRKGKLKELFARIFHNDGIVADKLLGAIGKGRA